MIGLWIEGQDPLVSVLLLPQVLFGRKQREQAEKKQQALQQARDALASGIMPPRDDETNPHKPLQMLQVGAMLGCLLVGRNEPSRESIPLTIRAEAVLGHFGVPWSVLSRSALVSKVPLWRTNAQCCLIMIALRCSWFDPSAV